MSWRKRIYGRFLTGILTGTVLVVATVSCGEAPEPESSSSAEKQQKAQNAQERKKNSSAVRQPEKKTKKTKQTIKDHVSGSLKVRFSAVPEESEKVQVRADSSNIQILNIKEESPGKETRRISAKERRLLASLRTARGANTLAAGIAAARPGKKIFWSPAMQEGAARRSRIVCCELSPDSSVMVFVETLGEHSGPFGSRLVYLDTHRWLILHVEHLLEYYIREVSFFPDGSLLFTCRGQESLRTADMAVHFDPVKSRVLGEYKRAGLRKAWAGPDGKTFFATFRKETASEQQIGCYSLADPEGNEGLFSVRGENLSPVLTFSPDGKTLYSCGNKTLEVYSVPELKLLEKTLLPDGFSCAGLLAVASGVLVAAPEEHLRQKSLLIRDGQCRPFGELSGGYLFAVPEFKGKAFGALLSKKGQVSCFALSTLEEIRSVIPEECRERTQGKPWKVFALKHRHDLLSVLDLTGNFYLLYRGKNERKYRKEILISSAGGNKK